ncbi:MAG: hypothetical protein ACRC4W_07445 [Treponemataceae bacterium]
MKIFIVPCILLTLFSSCATFGIQHISRTNAQENIPYILKVKAWDKKSDSLSVIFFYRINNSPWMQSEAIFNGEYFEYTINAKDLKTGSFEYYAQIINSKQEPIESKISRVKILSFAQAKKQRENEYFSYIKDKTEYDEFYFNETISLQIALHETENLTSVQCNVTSNGKTETYKAKNEGDGLFEVVLPPPHNTNTYTYQWKISWNDDSFAEINNMFPIVQKQIPVYDQRDLQKHLETSFQQAISIRKIEYLQDQKKIEVHILAKYDSILDRFSLEKLKMNLILRRKNGRSKIYKVEELYPDQSIFYVQIPFSDLDDGNETFSILYDDIFDGIGVIEKEFFPKNGIIIKK